ncbi:efflux transporter outer membrane subunit [Azorhizobium caulinodans]|nr:efflux transporter outer membrane subunit [Azorhizobium caulinodans]
MRSVVGREPMEGALGPWGMRKARRGVSCAFGLALFTAGCAALPETTAEAPALPSAYAAADVPLARRDTGHWWRTFRDPALSRLVDQAMDQNLSVAQARARLTAARAQAAAANTLFLPTAGAGGTAIATTNPSETDDPLRRPLMAGFDMSWDVGLFGLAENANRSATASAAIVAADLESVQISVTAEVARAYIMLRAVQQQHVIARAALEARRKRSDLVQTRIRTGLAALGEEAEAALALAEAKAELADLDARAASLRLQIATLLGSATPDPALETAGPQPMPAEGLPASHPADLLRARPDVRAAEQRVLRASAEAGIALSDLYPKLRLVGTIGAGAPFTNSAFGVAGGPVLQIPLLDYGRREANLTARKAQVEEAEAAYRQTVLDAYKEASDALAALSASRKAVTGQKAAVAAAAQTERSARVLSSEGLADRARLWEAETALLDRRRRLVQAQEVEAVALVALYKALGGAAPVAGRE